MRRWADYGYFAGGPPDGPVGLFSPDHSHFVVALKKGNLERNTNEYSLPLFRSDESFKNPKPDVLVTMSSSTNREGLKDVRWLADNQTLVFIGESPGETAAIYGINIRTMRLKKLTSHSESSHERCQICGIRWEPSAVERIRTGALY